jgi:hypothetical protein
VSGASDPAPVAQAAPPEGERTAAGAPSIVLAPAEAQVLALQRQMGNRAVNHLLRSPHGTRLLQRRRLPEPKDIAALEKTTGGAASADATAVQKGVFRLLVLAQEQLTPDEKKEFAVRLYTGVSIADWRKHPAADQSKMLNDGEAHYKTLSDAERQTAQAKALEAVRPDLVLGDPKLIDTGPRSGSTDAANIQKLIDNSNKIFANIASGTSDGDIKDVFGAASVANAKGRYANGRFWMNKLHTADKIVTDRSGYSSEVGQGGLTGHHEIIRLHPSVIDKPDEDESVVTLVHESMHAGNNDIGDEGGYIDQSDFKDVSTAKKLTNAAHFEVVPRRILAADFAFAGEKFIPKAAPGSSGSGPKLTPKQQAVADATNMYRSAWALGLNLHLLFVRVFKNPADWNTVDLATVFGLPHGTHFSDVLPFWSKVMGLTVHERTTIDATSSDASKAPVSSVDIALSEGVIRKLSKGRSAVPKFVDADKFEHDGATAAELGAISTVDDERDLLIRLVRRKQIISIASDNEDTDVKVVKTMGSVPGFWTDILKKRPPTAFPSSFGSALVGGQDTPAPRAGLGTEPDDARGTDVADVAESPGEDQAATVDA